MVQREAMTRLTCLGVDHTFADAAVRSCLVLDESQQRDLLARVRRVAPAAEAMILSTCSRTELYVAAHPGIDIEELWHALLTAAGVTRPSRVEEVAAVDAGMACANPAVLRRHLSGADAVEHLFRVACGLESRLLGEPEILGQLRAARDDAHQAGAIGKVLHRTVRMALELGKQARSATEISTGGTGIGAAVGATVAEWEADHGPARVLLLGAGTVAAAALTQLRRQTAAQVTVVNRTRARAEALAAEHGAAVGSWRRRADLLATHDIVVSAVSSDVPVLSAPQIRAGDGAGGLTCVDTAIPATLPEVHGVRVVTLDDLDDRRDELQARRRAAIPEVEAMVRAMLTGWRRWFAGLGIESQIAELYRAAEVRDHQVLAGALGRSPVELARLERAELRRLLHHEVQRRRTTAGSRPGGARA